MRQHAGDFQPHGGLDGSRARHVHPVKGCGKLCALEIRNGRHRARGEDLGDHLARGHFDRLLGLSLYALLVLVIVAVVAAMVGPVESARWRLGV